jgi:hypothetical protein
MNQPAVVALCLSVPLFGLGLASAAWQLRGLRRLAARAHVPSDERNYLRRRHRLRLANGVILTVIGAMIAGAYVSGMEARADQGRAAFAPPPQDRAPGAPDGAVPPPTPEERQFFRFWSSYWIAVLVLAFVLILCAIADAIETRRYGLTVYRELRDEHRARLARDLAVFKQQKTDRFGNRFAGESE